MRKKHYVSLRMVYFTILLLKIQSHTSNLGDSEEKGMRRIARELGVGVSVVQLVASGGLLRRPGDPSRYDRFSALW